MTDHDVWQSPPQPPHNRPRRRLAVLATALAGVLLLAAAGVYVVHGLAPTMFNRLHTSQTAHNLASIEAMPETHLLPPGSHVFGRDAADASLFGGPETYAVFVGVNAADTEVFNYYKQQLVQRGWTGPNPGGLAGPMWTRGNYVFSLVFPSLFEHDYPDQDKYATLFTVGIRYSSHPAASP